MMGMIKCPYCGKEIEKSNDEYCEFCSMRIMPYKSKEAILNKKNHLDVANNKENVSLAKNKKTGDNQSYFKGFAWAIIALIAMLLQKSRLVSPVTAIFSVILCIKFLYKNEKKIVLSIIGIIIDIAVILLVLAYYL